MIGKRLPDDTGRFDGESGSYWRLRGAWYCVTPNGHAGALGSHDVVEHDDGTVTVSPSILVSDHTGELWHGYLERGVWREV